jgi:hypothetical protein
MYTFCKRNKSEYNNANDKIFSYGMSTLPLGDTSGIKPQLCNNLYQPYQSNRGIPSNLNDINTNLRGQDRRLNHCNNDSDEIQFSTIRDIFVTPLGPPPSSTWTVYSSPSCNGQETPCMEENCPSRIQSKDSWKMNQVRPIKSYGDLTACTGYSFK